MPCRSSTRPWSLLVGILGVDVIPIHLERQGVRLPDVRAPLTAGVLLSMHRLDSAAAPVVAVLAARGVRRKRGALTTTKAHGP